MKVINGITYLEPGEKHPNADKIDKKKGNCKFMEIRNTIASGYSNKSELQKITRKGAYYDKQ